MGWRVKSNHLGAVARAMPRELDKAVDDFASDLSSVIKSRAWFRTGVLVSTVKPKGDTVMHAEIQVGIYRGRGFYSGFQEFGTRHQRARPVVVPAAHESEPIFAAYATDAVQRASRAS